MHPGERESHMTKLSIVNPRLHYLLGRLHPKWRTIAERSAALFLAGGGLLLITAALFAVQAFTAIVMEGIVTGVISFIGIILSYVGLLCLYPWFATRTPRLARAGFVLVALPTLMIALLLVWGVATHLPIGAVPSPVDLLPDIGGVFVVIFLLFAVGVGLFGIVSLRTGIPSGITGVLLLGLGATWIVLLAASSVYGSKFPAWLDALTFGVMAIALSGIGHSLRAESIPISSAEQSTDTTA